ncbi:unnamed protein product [Pleuronectes platessa]|uniref:Uncharacterized protein n=1 Tax=Pleuronectes platessa TaxID=8262 RepID=A0A9N7VH72_PLEPL|nr:unnamed protein product [Pleuronectes platessa]
MPFYGPVHLSCNDRSPGISSMLLRLCWETQQTFLRPHLWMCHPGGAGLPVQPDWTAGASLLHESCLERLGAGGEEEDEDEEEGARRAGESGERGRCFINQVQPESPEQLCLETEAEKKAIPSPIRKPAVVELALGCLALRGAWAAQFSPVSCPQGINITVSQCGGNKSQFHANPSASNQPFQQPRHQMSAS